MVYIYIFKHITCSIWGPPDEGGQHLHRGLVVGGLLQASLHLLPHALLHLQQLRFAQPELRHRLLDLARLLRQAVRHGRHHGGALGAAALRQQEADVRVRDQAAHRLVQAAGVPERGSEVRTPRVRTPRVFTL